MTLKKNMILKSNFQKMKITHQLFFILQNHKKKKVNEKRSKKENFVLQMTNKQIAETCKETIKMDKKRVKFFE